MTIQTPAGDQSCPNCRAFNSARAVVCSSCGINLELYRQALPHIREREMEQARSHEEELIAAAATTVAEDQERHRKQGKQQLTILIVTLGALAVLVVSAAAIYRYAEAERQARLVADYSAATLCLAAQDYFCAVDGFGTVLERDGAFAGAREGLSDARFGLATQFISAGQWEAAIRELELLLQNDPANQPALIALRDTYDRWIQDTLGRGDFLKALGLRLQYNARFPNEPLAPLPTPSPTFEGGI